MGQMWSTIRRRALIGLITAVCASTAWSPSAQAAPSKSAGNEVAAVGHPQVITLTEASPPTERKPNSHGKPFLGADTDGLAEAKKRAGHMAATTTPSVATSQPQAGIFNGANQPGLSAGDVGFCCTPPDTTGAIGPNHYVEFVNTQIAVYDRSLKQLSTLDMATFVAAPAGLNVSRDRVCDAQELPRLRMVQDRRPEQPGRRVVSVRRFHRQPARRLPEARPRRQLRAVRGEPL